MYRSLSILSLLAILARCGDAKYPNYDRILSSPEYQKMLSWFAPEKMLKNGNNTLLNTNCRVALTALNNAIIQGEEWALTMLDASSKLPSGALRGNLMDLGHYEECSAVHNESSEHVIRGLHCMYSISPTHETITLPADPTLSVCLPASCSADDIFAFFNATTYSSIANLKDLEVKMVSATCSSIRPLDWDWEFVVCLTILLGLVAFLIACTVIEQNHKSLKADRHESPMFDILAKFSLKKSAASIFDMQVKNGTLPAIQGLRCLGLALVILFHTSNLFLPASGTINSLDFLEWSQTWRSIYIFIEQFGVDIYFTLSGFLMTYLFLNKKLKQKKFHVLMYYFHRYIRLTPAVVALMIFTIVFVPKLGSGPVWNKCIDGTISDCRMKWWTTLVYLQNFVYEKHHCLHHLWYLAVDMQLYLLSPLILLPLYHKPKFGLILLAALLFSFMALSASIIGIRKIPVFSYKHRDNSGIIDDDVYINVTEKPYHRAAPWFVGILLGYEVVVNKHRQLNRWSALVGWLVAIASFAFCIFGTKSFMDPHYEYNVVWETFFSVVSRPIWGLGICWIIYASIKNQAGFVSTILSSRIFLPFSKLSYSMYLTHYLILVIDNATMKTQLYFSEYFLWSSFTVTITCTCIVAFFFSLLFEAPIVTLVNMLETEKESQKQRNNENDNDSNLADVKIQTVNVIGTCS